MQIPGFQEFAWGKINALKENLSEKHIFKQLFEDLKKKGNEINSGIIIPLFLYDVTMPLSISSRTTSQLIIICIATSQEYAI